MTPEEQRREVARMDYELYTKEASERLGFEVQFAEMVFKALILTNGGAMVALFSLVGALGSRNVLNLVVAPHRLWIAFVLFSLGLISVLIAGVCAYFTQRFFAESTVNQSWIAQADMVGRQANPAWETGVVDNVRIGARFIIAAIVCVIVSCAGFVIGCAAALMAVLPR